MHSMAQQFRRKVRCSGRSRRCIPARCAASQSPSTACPCGSRHRSISQVVPPALASSSPPAHPPSAAGGLSRGISTNRKCRLQLRTSASPSVIGSLHCTPRWAHALISVSIKQDCPNRTWSKVTLCCSVSDTLKYVGELQCTDC